MPHSYRISMNRRQFAFGSAAMTAGLAAGSGALAFSSQKSFAQTAGYGGAVVGKPTSLCADLHARIGAHLAETARACSISPAGHSQLVKISKCPHCATRIGATA